MLDRYFRKPCLVRRLRSRAAGPYLDEFATALLAEGYTREPAARHIRDGAHLGDWALGHGIPIRDIDESVSCRFVRHLARCRCFREDHDCRTPFRARVFLAHLRTAGVVTAPAPVSEAVRVSSAIERYADWMRRHRGVAETTLARHSGLIEALIETIGDDPTRYDAFGVRAFVLARIRDHERHSGGKVTAIVRSFLRYQAVQGRCSPDLVDAVPTVASWRLSKLPIYLPADKIERIIDSCDSGTPSGLRDRAVLLLLARLGLRAGDVANLRLGDIDWKTGRFRVMGKGRREVWLPLPQDAGEALLTYLQRVRPAVSNDHVFLKLQAPIAPCSASSVSHRVAEAIRRAGVEAPAHGLTF